MHLSAHVGDATSTPLLNLRRLLIRYNPLDNLALKHRPIDESYQLQPVMRKPELHEAAACDVQLANGRLNNAVNGT
ncbi:hypothetical protein H0H81_011299 [Sphagnurus paluster]|uniref:Uncharacterized protein n=1 Tax=Sphagnurus paluster TaxID=117069 RepID=A0A9P7K3Z1_9AGAR|nr:hypothetical protein H0H81_011299 [Sphagnurus paluster]